MCKMPDNEEYKKILENLTEEQLRLMENAERMTAEMLGVADFDEFTNLSREEQERRSKEMNDKLFEMLGITEEDALKLDKQNHEKARKERLEKIQSTKFSEELSNALKPFLKNAVFISPSGEKTKTDIGRSKIGGKPHLPEGFKWYRNSIDDPLTFLMQINLSEVHEYDNDNLLPDKGILYFFYDIENQPWVSEDDEKGFAVYYFDGDISKLSPVDFPDDTADEFDFYYGYADINCIIDEREISFFKKNDLPSYEDFTNTMNITESEEYEAAKYSLLGYDSYEYSEKYFKLLGYSDIIQNSLSEEFGEDHILLCQLSTYETGNRGVMFGDGGHLYFYISKEDLKNKRFDNIKISLQCY